MVQNGSPTELQPTAIRALYTVILFMGHLSGGMMAGAAGPAIVDIRYLLGDLESKEKASMSAITMQTTFMLVGACIGGFLSFLYKWSLLKPYLNRQLFTAILTVMTAFLFGITPQVRSIYLSYGLGLLSGIGGGNMLAIAITWLIEMWTGKILAAILQSIQLCFGIGTIIGPLVMRPHLFGYMNETDVKGMSVMAYEEKIDERRRSLTVPFAIVGVVMGTVGLFNLVLYFTYFFRYRTPSLPESSSESQKVDSTETLLLERPENRTQLRLFLTLIIIIFAGNNIAEISYLAFQDTFLQSLKDVKLSASDAAVVGSITSTTYTAGRGVNIFVSLVLSAGNLLLVHYCLALLSLGALFWSTQISQLAIQANAALIGYAFSAIMPAMFAYLTSYIVVNDRRNAMFTISMALPNIFTPMLIGHYIEKIPAVLVYLDLSVLVVAMAFFMTVRFWFIAKSEQKEKEKKRWKQIQLENELNDTTA